MKNGLTSNWMTTPVKIVSPQTSVVEARRIMNAEKIRAMPVVKDEKVVGIVTWRGLLRTDIPVIDGALWKRDAKVAEHCVGDIMTVNPIGIFPHSTMPKAARIMLENKIPALPVFTDNHSPLGILTTSDIFRFILAELPDIKPAILVKDYMSDDLVTVTPDTSLLEAQRLMGTKRIRSLPVVDDGKLIGLVTRTDMMKVEPSRFASHKNQEQSLAILLQSVEKIMTRSLVVTTPQDTLLTATRLMLENKIHCLPVLENGNLSGIITDSDLFRMVMKKFF